MKRLNFTLDDETVHLLERLARNFFDGNKSRTVRAALESLDHHTGPEGWVITGYTILKMDEVVSCHTCGKQHPKGALLYQPVFERGKSPGALPAIPRESWVECSGCVQAE